MAKKLNLTVADAAHKYTMLAKASKKANEIQKNMCNDLNMMEAKGARFAYIMEIRHFINKIESSL